MRSAKGQDENCVAAGAALSNGTSAHPARATARETRTPASRTRLGSGPGQVRLLYQDFGSVAHRLKRAAEKRGKPEDVHPPLPPPPVAAPGATDTPHAAIGAIAEGAATLQRSRWPRPCTTAFQGVVGEVAGLAARYTEADPHGVAVALLVGVGSEIGRKAHVVVGGRPHHANVLAALVGNTARGRKGTATGIALDVLGRAAPDAANRRVGNGISTGEGLIHRIRDTSVRTIRKVVNGEERVTTTEEPGVADKRLLFVESEGGRFCGRIRKGTLAPVLSAAFDGEDLTIATRHSPLVASKPHVAMLLNVTREVVSKRFPEIEIESGLANRILWVLVDRPRIDPDGGRIPESELDRCAATVGAAIKAASGRGEIGLDTAATALWRQEYERLDREQPGRYGQVTARAAVLVRRLALIYAILGQSQVVTSDHLRAALDLWRYCDESAKLLFGDALGNSRARRIYEALLERPEGMSQEEIRQEVFSKHLTAGDLQDALRELQSFRMIQVLRKTTPGRTATVLRAVPRPSDDENSYEVVE